MARRSITRQPPAPSPTTTDGDGVGGHAPPTIRLLRTVPQSREGGHLSRGPQPRKKAPSNSPGRRPPPRALFFQGKNIVSVRIRPSRSRLLAAAVSCAFALPAAARPGDDGQDRFIVHYAPQAAEVAETGRAPMLERTVQAQGLRVAASRRLATGATLVVTDRKL